MQSDCWSNCSFANSKVGGSFCTLIVSSLSDCCFHSIGTSGCGNGCTVVSTTLNSVGICYGTIASVATHDWSISLTVISPALQSDCRSNCSFANREVSGCFSCLVICCLSDCCFHSIGASGTGNCCTEVSTTLNSISICYSSIASVTRNNRSICLTVISPALQSDCWSNCSFANSKVGGSFCTLIVSSLSDCCFHSIGTSGCGNGSTVRCASLNSVGICYGTITCVTRNDWSISLTVISPVLQSDGWGYCCLANSEVSSGFSTLIVSSLCDCCFYSIGTSGCRNCSTEGCATLNSVGICYGTITSVATHYRNICLTVISPTLQSDCWSNRCFANGEVGSGFSCLVICSLSDCCFHSIGTSGCGNGCTVVSTTLDCIAVSNCTVTSITTHDRSICLTVIRPTLQSYSWSYCCLTNSEVGCGLCTLIVSGLSNRSFYSICTSGSRNGSTVRCASLNSVGICYGTITCVTRNDWSISLTVISPVLQSDGWGYCCLANSEVSSGFSTLIVSSLCDCCFYSIGTSGCRNCSTEGCATLNSVGICYGTITSVATHYRNICLTVISPTLQSDCWSNCCFADSKVGSSFSTLIICSLSNRGFDSVSASGTGNCCTEVSTTLYSISICYGTIASISTHDRSIGLTVISPALQSDCWSNCSLANREVGSSFCALIVRGLSNRSLDSVSTSGCWNG